MYMYGVFGEMKANLHTAPVNKTFSYNVGMRNSVINDGQNHLVMTSFHDNHHHLMTTCPSSNQSQHYLLPFQ